MDLEKNMNLNQYGWKYKTKNYDHEWILCYMCVRDFALYVSDLCFTKVPSFL